MAGCLRHSLGGHHYSPTVASYDYPEDEFDARADDGREPIGTHRAPVPVWRSWMPLLLILILVPTLAWGAVSLLSHAKQEMAPAATQTQAPAPAAPDNAEEKEGQDDDKTGTPAKTEGETQTETENQSDTKPTQEPAATQADLTTGITIHNGSTINGLAGRTGDKLTHEGYSAVHVEQGVYTLSAPEVTTIYYADPSHAATAQAIGAMLGITNIVESAEGAQSNPIVIVLRADFSE